MRKTWLTLLGVAIAAGSVGWWVSGSGPERQLPVPVAPAAEGPGLLVVDLVDGATEADVQAIEAKLGADLDWVHPLAVDEALVEGEVSDLAVALRRLQGDPRVEVAEASQTFSLEPGDLAGPPEVEPRAGFPNDPMYGKQWNLPAMGAPEGWRSTPRGKGVVVAVIDTGVTQVEDLDKTRVLKGASFVPGAATAADDQGHGTHVAGTIAQSTHNGKGVAGVAPEATILPIKVLSAQGFGRSPWIAAGIDHAVDEGAQVINLSLGGSYSPVIHNAIKKARKKGVLVIAAAGNSGRKGVGYPGALEETIGVSALGPDGQLAPYSSWGKGVDIAAPGGDTRKPDGGILQDTVGPGGKGHRYAAYQGTSMATPHVAGAAAILLSTGMSADAVERALLETAQGKGSWDPRIGHGHLSLDHALGAFGPTGGPLLFGLGAVLALLIGRLSGARAPWLVASTVTAAVTAGGLFFLAYLPLPGHWALNLVSAGFLEWPAVAGWASWVHFPLWASALAPAAVGFVLGAPRATRPLAMGFAAGIGAHLFYGAATGALDPWWMGSSLGSIWLVINATLCVLIAMALAGTEKLERESVSG